MTYANFCAFFFYFNTPFLNFELVFRGHAQLTEKKIAFLDGEFYAEYCENKNYFETSIISEVTMALKIVGAFWANLKNWT